MKKGQNRTSIIWKIPKSELFEIVQRETSLARIIKHFGLNASSNYKTLKRRLNEENIDYSHIPLGVGSNKGRLIPKTLKPLKEVMIKNSTYDRGSLKKRLLKNKMLKNYCYNCGLPAFWNGKKLILVLDHINGVNNDHRLKNLRMLCPNCNSQTDTFAGKTHKIRYNCKQCGVSITRYAKSGYCSSCYGKIYVRRKVKDRPSKKQLLKKIKKTNYCAVGREYGVSDNTIRKWLK